MPEKEPQKIDEPKSFGGNSANGHPQPQREAETAKSRPRGTAKTSDGSKIPIKIRRVPLKNVQTTSTEIVTKDTSSDQSVTRGVENDRATRVRKVPDFKKLHSKWQKKIEKAKRENRSAIDVREFPLTPCGKFTPNKPCPRPAVNKEGENPSIISTSSTQSTTTGSEQLSPFKADSASLHTILHGNGEPPSLSHRATLACGELRIPKDAYRYSMYRRRPAAPPSVAMKPTNNPCMSSSVSHTQARREMLARLAATTLGSLRTVTKVNRDNMSDEITRIKKTLTFSAEDECGYKVTNPQTLSMDPSSSQLNGHGIDSIKRHRVECSRQRRVLWKEPELVPKDQFYILEPELCDLLKVGVAHCIGGRGQCRSPVAHLLDNVYFVPISNNY